MRKSSGHGVIKSKSNDAHVEDSVSEITDLDE